MTEAPEFANFANVDFPKIKFGELPSDLLGLDLSFTGVTNRGLEETIQMFPNLVSLHLQGAQFQGDVLRSLTDLRSLRHVNLRHTPLTAETLRPLGELSDLETLLLERTGIGDAHVELLVGLASLSRLDLSHHPTITDRVLDILPRMSKLVDIDLSWTQITRVGLDRSVWGRPRQIYITGTNAA